MIDFVYPAFLNHTFEGPACNCGNPSIAHYDRHEIILVENQPYPVSFHTPICKECREKL